LEEELSILYIGFTTPCRPRYRLKIYPLSTLYIGFRRQRRSKKREWNKLSFNSLHWILIQLRNGSRISEAITFNSLHWIQYTVRRYIEQADLKLSILYIGFGAVIDSRDREVYFITFNSLHWIQTSASEQHVQHYYRVYTILSILYIGFNIEVPANRAMYDPQPGFQFFTLDS